MKYNNKHITLIDYNNNVFLFTLCLFFLVYTICVHIRILSIFVFSITAPYSSLIYVDM